MPRTSAQILYAETHKEELKQKRKEWALRNGCWWKKYRNDTRYSLWLNAKNRARIKGIPFSITKEDIVVPDICPVFGIPLARNVGEPGSNSPSIDRIRPELGYVPGNIVVISHRANQLKSNATVGELERVTEWLKGVLNGHAS